jgi:hypothetical protein
MLSVKVVQLFQCPCCSTPSRVALDRATQGLYARDLQPLLYSAPHAAAMRQVAPSKELTKCRKLAWFARLRVDSRPCGPAYCDAGVLAQDPPPRRRVARNFWRRSRGLPPANMGVDSWLVLSSWNFATQFNRSRKILHRPITFDCIDTNATGSGIARLSR